MLGTQDLDVLFNTDEFAVNAVLTTTTGTKTIRVIFDEVYDQFAMRPMFDSVYGRAGARAESRLLSATCKTSDILGAHHKDTLTIGGKIYPIVGITPQQDGNITILELQAP
jgi:hypothetical protein